MADHGVGEAPCRHDRLFRVMLQELSKHAGAEGQSLRNEWESIKTRGNYEQERGILSRALSLAADGALDGTGKSPIQLAALNGRLSVIAALVAAGEDINHRTSQAELTALDCAILGGKVDVLDVLVGHGADVRASSPHGDTPLHVAAMSNNVGAIGFLVRAGADIGARENKQGSTPLHKASERGFCEVIATLLRHGAEVDAMDKKGETPLVTAIRNTKLSSIDALVAGGADVNRRNEVDDMAPLDLAASCGNLQVLKALLGYGSRSNAVNSVGGTALHFATTFEAAGLVHALVDAGADVNVKDADGKAPIHKASTYGSASAITALTQRGADKEARTNNGMTPLQIAAKRGRVSSIDALVAAGADIHLRTIRTDSSALDLAAGQGHLDVMEALVRHGVDVKASNAQGYGPLYAAAARNWVPMIRALVQAGADVHGSVPEWTPLDAASGANAADAIATLAELGADLTRINQDGLTPLQLAVEEGHLDAVNALLVAGADPNQESGDDWVVFTAITREREDILTTLLLNGADPNRETSGGQTALLAAVELQDVGMVYALLEAGADVNTGVDDGNARSIHIACGAYSTYTMLILLEHGASIDVRDGNGKSPLHHAAESCVEWDSDTERLDILLRAGADETARDSKGLTPAEYVRRTLLNDTCQDALARVTRALERAPADRAWRRRGTVLLCRAFSEREVKRPEPLVETPAKKSRRTEVWGGRDRDAAARKADTGRLVEEDSFGNFRCLLSRLFALEEEGLFRTVVSFL